MHSSVNKVGLLFNPWSDKESVYLKHPTQRNEYIISDRAGIGKSATSDSAYVSQCFSVQAGVYVPSLQVYTFDQFDPLSVDLAFNLLSPNTTDPVPLMQSPPGHTQ